MLINKITTMNDAAVGDRVLYTLQVINDDAYEISNVQVVDVLPPQLVYVPDSLRVNSQVPVGDLSSGIVIGTLAAGCLASIRFEVDVVAQGSGTITNTAMGIFTYQAPGMTQPATESVVSNVHTLTVINPVIQIKKEVNQTSADLGDILYFTLTLTQVGDTELNNVIIQDQLNSAFALIPGSVSVNDHTITNPDLSGGIVVPYMAAGSTVIVCFAAKVVGGTSLGCLTNIATATGSFAYPSGAVVSRTYTSNAVGIYLGINNFKQITIDSSFTVPDQKPDIEDIVDIEASIVIKDSYPITTAKGVSNEGQVLTGSKVVVNGTIKVMVTYTALISTQDIYAIYCEIPFSTYVVLPPDYKMGYQVESVGVVEKATYNVESARSFYVNIALLIKALVVV